MWGLNEAREGIGKYFQFYNENRPHQALSNQTPIIVHFGGRV
jgi:transposase InsO family protein